ncbi:isoleucine--tRNA ligase [Ruminococcus sp.]|uniref:isoleucine--tRNA ligase n=1 Tax=Ruminococcus sp. TaxID=41978 RepID=UPI0025FAE3C9|nr:isoleucine--tRNA ligase [Ruminococcus sp.]
MKNLKYEELAGKPNIPEIQADVLKFWKDENVFEKSVNKEAPEVVFYDGPPFPTGKPHHGTILVSFIKDMIARYWTMKGYKVPRVWGWDCHGLPIENQVEKDLGIDDKNYIENTLGIDKFNDKCFELVSGNNEAWKEYVEQMARWVDYDGAYKTMNPTFMESVMWAFKQCYDKGLIYRDYRVTPYCTHCETSLSISDTRESDSTRPRQDRWIITKFRTEEVIDGKPVFFLAWTTTPWTLPSNLCLAVGKDLEYAFCDVGEEIFIACTAVLGRYDKIFGKEPKIVKTAKGEELVGRTYEPLFPYFADLKDKAFRVVTADYVGADEGVGIVHTAPAFGEDDYWTCKNNGIPLVNPVDAKGRFTEEVTDFYEADGEKNVIEMNPTVIRFLYEQGKAVADGTIEHNYPHCWRCKRPLIYKAMDAWYFDVTKIKDKLIAQNELINWVPETVKHGRFGKWLENARDWNISRNRYWSTPIPIWECDTCGDRTVLGSIDEIEQASGVRLTNLHRQYMDKIKFKCNCEGCTGTKVRVPEVLDCWFESGSVPFAQKHYPFENKEWFDSHFPSDFIVEYTGQIRCWFYYLHVLSVALFDKPCFSNCVVHGTILAKDGKKLSKSSRNYTDPMELMKKFGTDAFRLYLYQTNAMLIGDLQFDDNGISDALQQIIFPLWNACNFYISYANIDDFKPESLTPPTSDNQLDRWMLAKLWEASDAISKNMDAYFVNKYVENLIELVDGLTNWFIRRSRRRFWEKGLSEDKKNAYETLYYVLVNMCKLFAPAAPIIAEKLYKTLTGGYSVHLESWAEIPDSFRDDKLLDEVKLVRNVIYLARSIRSKNNVKNRQPLSELCVALSDSQGNGVVESFKDIIAEELNVKSVKILESAESVAEIKYAPNFNEIRNRYPDRIPDIIKAVKSGKFALKGDKAVLNINGTEEEFDSEVILVTYQAKAGQHVASDKGIVVSLDLTITDELRDEGFARDIVRSIQDARRKLGCAITDKISMQLTGDVPAAWVDYICGETLSDSGEIADADTSYEVEYEDGRKVTVALKK